MINNNNKHYTLWYKQWFDELLLRYAEKIDLFTRDNFKQYCESEYLKHCEGLEDDLK